MKIVSYIAGYLVLLLPAFLFAVVSWVDMADPPDPSTPDSFWVSDLGQWMWFGMAIVLPALALLALNLALRVIRSQSRRHSRAVV